MKSYFIKTLFFLLARVPLPWLHRCAQLIGKLLSLVPNDLRRVTRINLRLCFPELNEKARQRLEQQSLIELVKTGLELALMWQAPTSKVLRLIRQITGAEHLANASASGKGVILAAPHLGMWELIGIYGSNRQPMTSLYRPPRIKALDSIMRHGRERLGASLVPTDASGIRALYKALARGELIALLPDQEPRWGNGMFVPFFNIPAYSMTLLPRLLNKSGATLLITWAERLPAGEGFKLHFNAASDACYSKDSMLAMQAINQHIESCVRTCPSQYQWSYRRFRTRPEGDSAAYYWRGHDE